MNRQHASYSFHFDDNTIGDEQVKTQANIKLNPVETDRHRMFSEHGQPIPAEQVRYTGPINVFK
jgi:hypothetical protein